MFDTSASLLDRLRQSPDAESWERLVGLYTPLIRGWLRQQAKLNAADADDLVQEVLTIVMRKLPEFVRQPRPGAFRRWLRTITVNCLRGFWRCGGTQPVATGDSEFARMLDQLEDPDSGLSRQWDTEHDRHITQKLLQLIRPSFEHSTWKAFEGVAIDGEAPEAVAARLGISVNAVFIAKSRVLTRLRQEGQGLID